MSSLITIYVCFLNFFNAEYILKYKYTYYILLSLLCLKSLYFDRKKLKEYLKKGDLFATFLIYMTFGILSTVPLLWGGSHNDILTAYIRIWLLLPIIYYIYANKNINLISGFIKASYLINLIVLYDLLKYTYLFGRIQSIFSHPNFYAFYLIMIILCIIYSIHSKKMNAKIGYPYIAFNIFMMVAAGSKTAFIVLGFILLYQFILFIKEKSKITKVIIVGITLVGILFTIICFGNRLANLRIFDINYGLAENQINSFTWRILKWKSNMEVWYKNILGVIFGYGYRSEQFYGMEGYSMHNEYLRIIFNTGIIGTILLLNFSVSFINKVIRIEDKDKKIFYISVLILIIIGSISENLFVASETTVMYLAILFSINSDEFKNKLMKREYKHINVSPLVSVIMSTYNESSNDLDLSIQSILQQSYKNIEFIIVLDNPQNKIIKNVLNRYKDLDERIVIIENEKNIGLVKSLNKALKVASGKYIARMDADDISDRDRILKQVNILESYNEISLVGTDILLIDEENIEIKNENLLISDPVQLKKCIGLCNCIAHPTWMFRKSILDDLKEYNEIPCAEDYDFLIRMAIYGYEFYNIDEKLLKYRIRQNSITQSSEYKQLIMTKRIRKAYKKSRGSVSNYNKNIDTNVDCNIHIKSKDLYYKIKNKDSSNILSKLVSKFVSLCNPYFRSHLISRMIIRTKVYKLL